MSRELLSTRLRRLFWRLPIDREVDEELAQHLELQARRFEQQGMPHAAARAMAVRRFGDVATVRHSCLALAHDLEDHMNRRELVHELRQDVGYAGRVLRKSPLFTLVAVATLAIGIGANTAIFSVVRAVLLRSLPYQHAARTVAIWNRYNQGGSQNTTAIAAAEFADIRDQQRSFDEVAAIYRQQSNLVGVCGSGGACEPERLTTYAVSPNLFRLLGVSPRLGRAFRDEEGAANSEPVVLVSHDLWMRRFAGDPALLGRSINLGGRLRTVIGIMPPEVRFPDAPVGFLRERGDLWTPYSWERDRGESRGNQFLAVLGRLRPAATLESARRDLDLIAGRFRSQYADRYAARDLGWSLAVVPLRDEMVGDARGALLVISGAVGLVLLIACVNVANLTLARGAARAREMALRAALGARRARLVRQLLTESTILALAAGALGTVLAYFGARALVALNPGSVPRLDGARLDGAVLALSAVTSLLTGILVGVVPALRHSHLRMHDALRGGARATGPHDVRRGLRSLLVVGEVAMALVVLVGAGLLLRSFVTLQRVDAGFRAEGTLTFQLTLPRTRYDSAAKIVVFHRGLQERLAAMPGVEHAAAVSPLPMSGDGWGGSFIVEERPLAPGEPEPHGEYAVSLPGYFRAMGITMREGRDFTAADAPGAPEVVVVDEALAARHWPGQSAIGKRVNLIGRPEGVWATVVGVVAHVHNGSPSQPGEPQIYMPFFQRPQTPLAYVLRTSGDPLALSVSARRAVHEADQELPVSRVSAMSSLENRALARERFNTLLFTIFAATALTLAAVGLYGVLGYLVSQRVGEIGIRLALGGQPRDVLRLVVGEGMAMALAGIALGVVCALLLSRFIGKLLYGVAPTDLATYVSIAGLLGIVALVASAIPARRATKVDPMVALRS